MDLEMKTRKVFTNEEKMKQLESLLEATSEGKVEWERSEKEETASCDFEENLIIFGHYVDLKGNYFLLDGFAWIGKEDKKRYYEEDPFFELLSQLHECVEENVKIV